MQRHDFDAPNTLFKKYAGLFRRPPNVANWIRLRRATSNAHVFNKISYAGLSKWSQRGGLEICTRYWNAYPRKPLIYKGFLDFYN